MTATYEPQKYPASQVGVSVLLIGDDDVVIRTSGLLWDTLPRFGEIRVVKLVPQSSVPFVDPSTFQLLFFHLSATNVSTELEALRDLREKSCKLSDEAVCVLVVPEAGSDVPPSTADFILTQPITAEHVEELLRGCSFLSEQSQNDSHSSASLISVGQQTPEPESTDPQAELGASVQESCLAEDWAGPSEALLQGSSEALFQRPSEALLQGPSEALLQGSSEALFQRPSEALPQGPSEALFQRPSEALPQGPSEALLQGPSEALTQGPSEALLQGPSEALTQGPSAELTSGDLQAFLHSKKEQKRRLQIKECCERLRELLPFIMIRMDTASTLEMTVKYMSYLRQHLPEDILEKTVKALEENETGTWYKPTKAPKKRKACMVRKKPTDIPMPTNESFADDFIAAHVLGRHIQPKVGMTQPTAVLPPPVESFDPRLDLNLASAQGIGPGETSAPVGQTFVMNQTYGQPAAVDPSCSLPMFWKQTRGPVPSIMMNQAFVPQMIQNPCDAMVLDEPSFPPVQTLMVGQDFFLPAGLDPVFAPPAATITMNQTFAPLVILHDPRAPEATANPPLPLTHPTMPRPIPTLAPWPDPLLSEILYDSSPSLPSLSSFQGGGRVDNLLQSPIPESPFSQWDFGSEIGPVYPFQSHFLESLAPPSPHHIQIQTSGSSIHFLAEVQPPLNHMDSTTWEAQISR